MLDKKKLEYPVEVDWDETFDMRVFIGLLIVVWFVPVIVVYILF